MDFVDEIPQTKTEFNPKGKKKNQSKLTIKHIKFESEVAYFELDELIIENLEDLRGLIRELSKEFK